MEYLYIIAGLILLFFGGEALLKGSISIAKRIGISNLLVSVVIVGFGTSMPEMTVSVGAALKGSPDIALGNIVGSNIANVLLILALCVMIYPIPTQDKTIVRDALMVVFASALLCALSFTGQMGHINGAILFSLLVAYIVWCYRQDKKKSAAQKAETFHHIEEDTLAEKPLSLPIGIAYAVGGLVLLVTGATFLVEGATTLARAAGISEAIIGLTLVAVGTSLPELATGLVAAFRKHGDVVIGNILGSNIFNILGILGITGMIAPIPMTGQIVEFDMWIMLAVAGALLTMLVTGKKLSRFEGGLMLAAYLGYLFWLYKGMGVA